MTDFREKVLSIVRGIPMGVTMTYAQVAEAAGSKGAHRAVGSIMKANYDPTVPCHRVIKSDGSVGDYNRGGPAAKQALLWKEGVHMGVDPCD
jgi:methylated-DNA-[protein]-cysteine S-methyltransferase